MITKRTAIWIVAITALATALWTGWWFYAGRIAISSFQNWADERRADGYDIGFSRIDAGGFPFQVDLTIHRFGMAAPGRLWVVSTDQARVSFRPWRFDRYQLDTVEPVRLITAVVPASRETPIVANSISGSFQHAVAGEAHSLQLIARDVAGPDGLRAVEIGLSGRRPIRRAGDHESVALSGRVELVDGDLPGIFAPGLSSHVSAAVADFDVFGPEPPAREGSALKRLGIWRDGGGLVEVHELALVWEELNLRGEGTLALDRTMRPMAAFAFDAVGIADAARRVETAGLIDDRTRRYIELGAGLLSLGGGQSGRVRVPVSAQDGILYLGPVAIAELPSLIPGYNPVSSKPATPPVDDFAAPPTPPTVSEETLKASPPRPVPVPVPSQ